MANAESRETLLRRIAELEGELDRRPDVDSLLQQLISSAPVGVIVVDEKSRLVAMNDEAETMFGYRAAEIVGESLGLLLPERFRADHSKLTEAYIAAPSRRRMGRGRDLFGVRKDGSEFPVEIGLGSIELPARHLYSALVVDITHRKTIEQEREKLIVEIQDAMAKIKTLSGLLPICASCKKIRDDKGYWNQIEVYLLKHSEAEFTHGLCPSCLKTLYSDLGLDR